MDFLTRRKQNKQINKPFNEAESGWRTMPITHIHTHPQVSSAKQFHFKRNWSCEFGKMVGSSRKWAYTRIIAGTIVGGVLGFYVMHRVEVGYKVTPLLFNFSFLIISTRINFVGYVWYDCGFFFLFFFFFSSICFFGADAGEDEREVKTIRERTEEERENERT